MQEFQLTPSNPQHRFVANMGATIPIGTSGVLDGGTLRVQQRVKETDEWVDDPTYTFTADRHLSVLYVVTTPFNRVLLDTPGEDAVVNGTRGVAN